MGPDSKKAMDEAFVLKPPVEEAVNECAKESKNPIPAIFRAANTHNVRQL